MADNAVVHKRTFETYDLTVETAALVTPRNIHLRFRLAPGKELHFKAGQFIQMFIPLPDGKIRRSSYSIASSPKNVDFFELCVTKVDGGISSTYLHSLKPGDKIQGMGPLGTFHFYEDGKDSVFVATGSGVAPFRAMIHDQLEKGAPNSLTLIFGNRFEEDLIYRQEWESLARERPNFKAAMTLSRGQWAGLKGYVQDHIDDTVADPASKNFYICGLKNMIDAVEQKLLSLGVPKTQIHFERFD
jgi:ferredoxin-NADP reductase